MTWKPLFFVLSLVSARLVAQTVSAPVEQAQAVTALPHGVVHHESFASDYLKGVPNGQGKYVVYTPPNYDEKRKPAYPVLYLMHGWGGDADAWVKVGHADAMLDRMIADGRAKPMVVVMPLAYGDMSFLTNGFEVWRDQKQISDNVNLFEKALLKEIMPEVEARYDVAIDREHRAIAGLSMGGLEALTIGLRNPELFASVGGFSSSIFPVAGADLTKLDPKKENLRVLWVACGTDDDLLSINRIFVMHLREQAMPVTAVETPGRHEWAVWRDNFRHFVPLLFTDGAPPEQTPKPRPQAADISGGLPSNWNGEAYTCPARVSARPLSRR